MTSSCLVPALLAGVALAGGATADSGPWAKPAPVGAPLTRAAAVAADASAPSLEELANATYKGVEEAGGPFTLTKGKWQGKPYEPGSASAPGVTLVSGLRLAGDLDDDGREEAVVLLAAATGGSGERSYLAVVRRAEAVLENIATAPVGDRVQVQRARLDGRRIVLDVVQAGEKDAACCPGDVVARSWELGAGALVEAAPVAMGRWSVELLGDDEWVLRSWDWEEPAPAAPEVTLKLAGTRLAGSAGCNNYFAPARPGAMPGDLAIGAIGSTRKMCPMPVMAVEERFMTQLAAVRQMRFTGGRLGLTYGRKDRKVGVMVFERRAGP